jgi:hypothetical protein
MKGNARITNRANAKGHPVGHHFWFVHPLVHLHALNHRIAGTFVEVFSRSDI